MRSIEKKHGKWGSNGKQQDLFLCLSWNWLHALLLRRRFIRRRCAVQRCKILQQQAVDEDIAASHFAQERALGGSVQKVCVTPGD
jgi:hypothetical protein